MQKNLTNKMPDIVITAGTAIGSVLALSEAITSRIGNKAYVLCTDEITSKILSKSKFIEEVVFITKSSEDNYIIDIKKWYETKNFLENPVLYFTTDNSCYYINRHREWFESKFKLCLPSSNIINNFTKKGLAEPEAFINGLEIPKTLVINNKNDVNEVLKNFSFPIILKPEATYLKKNIPFKIKVFSCHEDFLYTIDNYIEQGNSILCQEFIPGGDNASYYYIFYKGKNGLIKDNVGKKILQSTPNGGIMLKGRSEFDEKLVNICREFLDKIDYKGIGGIEFKKYKDTFYFIEMSVRLEGFFKINEMSNSNISLTSYFDLIEGYVPQEILESKQEDYFTYISFLPTLINYIKSKNIKQIFLDIFKIIFYPKFKIDIFSVKSMMPFLIQIFYFLKSKF